MNKKPLVDEKAERKAFKEWRGYDPGPDIQSRDLMWGAWMARARYEALKHKAKDDDEADYLKEAVLTLLRLHCFPHAHENLEIRLLIENLEK